MQSVRNQSVRDVELIVVDNSSTDATREIALRFADIVETRGPERSAQRNFGARLARADYLFFVDSDMILTSRVIEDCVSIAANVRKSAIILPEITVGQGFWAKCRALERSCYLGDDSVEAARFYCRQIFEEVGGYDENLVGGEDWDLSVRVAQGSRLPRISSVTIHDEGRVQLREHLAKKRYYAASFRVYWRKHPRLAIHQVNIVARRAFLRHWRRLIRHPILTPALISLKILELVASIAGVLQSSRRPTGGRGAQ